jgi:hypothetical protein
METLGSLVDKLSIVNQKIWHQEEIGHDPGAGDAEVAAAKRKINVLNLQRTALVEEFDTLFADTLSGKRKAEVYHPLQDYGRKG